MTMTTLADNNSGSTMYTTDFTVITNPHALALLVILAGVALVWSIRSWIVLIRDIRSQSARTVPVAVPSSLTIAPDKPWPSFVDGIVQRCAVRMVAGQSYVSIIVNGKAYHETTTSQPAHDLRVLSLLQPGDRVYLVLEHGSITEVIVGF